MKALFTGFLIVFGLSLFAQVGINIDGSSPDNSAMLDVKSTTKGLLPPRMSTEEMNSIALPKPGLLIYNLDVNALYWYNGLTWKRLNEITTETDPIFTTSPAGGIIPQNITDWNTAYGWGNHAAMGYLTSITETDPIFVASPSHGITPTDLGNWNLAWNNRIMSASGTSPLTLNLSANLLTGSIPAATTAVSGYLTFNDWNTFNNKQPALGYTAENQANKSANPALGTSDVLYPTQNAVKTYVTNQATNYIANSGMLQAGATFHIGNNGWIQGGNMGIGTASAPSYLLDINGSVNVMRIQTLPTSFSNTSVLVVDDVTGVVSKRTNAFTYGTVTSVNAYLPLSSSGGTDPYLSISQAGTASNGYLSSSDWNTFNGKESVLFFNNPLIRVGNSVSLLAATPGQNGSLSNADFTRLHGTTGSVLFFDASGVQQDNTQFFWDNTNNRLGIGTPAPAATLSVGSTSQFQVAGVDGQATITSSNASPFTSKSTSATGTGVIGVGNNLTAATFASGSGGAFVGSVCGVYGKANNVSGDRYGGYFYLSASANAFVAANFSGTNYKIIGSGSVSTIVETTDNKKAIMFCPESPEILFTDYGNGILTNGYCHISLDPTFTNNIIVDNENTMKVFVQLEGDCNGVYVANKTDEGFDVIELQHGNSSVSFSWSVVANRRDSRNANGEITSKHKGVRFPEFKGQ